MKLYSELAEYYYEIEKPGRKFLQEIKFLDSIYKKHRIRSVLDLGCGTGEHTHALQTLGYDTLGVDSSENMINYAKKRFPESKFEIGNMQTFTKPQPVDSIFSIFGTFNYLIKEDEIATCLDSIRKNLKSSGILVLEVWNAIPFQIIKRKPMTAVSESQINGMLIQRNRGFKIKSIEQQEENPTLVEVNYVYYIDKKEIKDRHIMRVFKLDEVLFFFKKFRFELLHIFSNYSAEKYLQYGSRMIIVLQKK